jgi:hypothetical protein
LIVYLKPVQMKTLLSLCLLFCGWLQGQELPLTGRWQLEKLEINNKVVYSRGDSLQTSRNVLGQQSMNGNMAKKYRKDSTLRRDSARQKQSFRTLYSNAGKSWLQFNDDHSYERLLSYGSSNDTTVQKGQYSFAGNDQLILSVKGFNQADTLNVSMSNNLLVLSAQRSVSPTVYTYSRIP